MLRLPPFTFYEPRSRDDAVRIKEDAGDAAMYVAGGTDLYPNMKRRHQTPATVVSVNRIADLHDITEHGHGGWTVGAAATLTDLTDHPDLARVYPAVTGAARAVSTPLLRNMGTLGGNLCLDTRCNYYNQSYEWRKAINFCMKRDGDICWVAPSSPRCWAVQSSDIAPVMVALGAEYVLHSSGGERLVPAPRFYHNDGIDYLTKRPHELLTEVRLPPRSDWDAVYWKLRRRGAFDFPVLGVAAWIRWDGPTVIDARIVLGGVASYPQLLPEAASILMGSQLDDDAVDAAAQAAYRPSKPMDNTDFALQWRKHMTRHYVRGTLRELRQRRA